MYIVVDETEYRHLSGLTFAPQTDMTGDQLPVNEFEADVYTDGMLYYGQWAYLYDDLDNIWAFYYIVYAQRVSAGVLHIRARSPLELMERVTLQEQYYSGAALDDVLDDTFNALGDGYTVGIDYTIDEALEAATVTGYCPEQNARERLQWVAFAVGAYVRTYGSASVDLLPVSQQATLIPLEKHFWRPKLTYSDIVTALTVTEYAYQQVLVPQNDNATTYKFPPTLEVEEQQIRLNNPGQITGARKNEIDVDGMYLITEDNSDAVLDRMSRRYFKRTAVDLDVIDNAEYWPGQSVIVYADPDTLIQGFIESAAFAFGKQARATLHLIAADTVESAVLNITCVFRDEILNNIKYMLPVGHTFNIKNNKIYKIKDNILLIYKPKTDKVSGTMVSEGISLIVEYEMDLDDMPDEIRVEVPPSKIDYGEGELIDYTGMVVKAYKDGEVWENEFYRFGVIPNSELILDDSFDNEYILAYTSNPPYKTTMKIYTKKTFSIKGYTGIHYLGDGMGGHNQLQIEAQVSGAEKIALFFKIDGNISGGSHGDYFIVSALPDIAGNENVPSVNFYINGKIVGTHETIYIPEGSCTHRDSYIIQNIQDERGAWYNGKEIIHAIGTPYFDFIKRNGAPDIDHGEYHGYVDETDPLYHEKVCYVTYNNMKVRYVVCRLNAKYGFTGIDLGRWQSDELETTKGSSAYSQINVAALAWNLVYGKKYMDVSWARPIDGEILTDKLSFNHK